MLIASFNVVLVCVLMAGCQEFDVDETDWVDHTDMLYYDTVKRKMVKPDESVSEDRVCPQVRCDADCSEIQAKLHKCQQKLDSYVDQIQAVSDVRRFVDTDQMAYVKRYINQILTHFYKSSEIEVVHYRIEVNLNPEDRERLMAFARRNNGYIQEVDEILSRMIVTSQAVNDDGFPLFPYFLSWLPQLEWQMVTVVVAALLVWLLLSKMSLFKTVSLVFIASVTWHWIRLYKEAQAKRLAGFAKLDDASVSCKPFLKSWSKGLQYWFFSIFNDDDPCYKFYSHIHVDPFWDVSFAVAIADTITSIVVAPFGPLGHHLGLFYKNLSSSSPWLVSIFVIPATILIGFFFVIAGFRYRVSFLYGLISFHPSPNLSHSNPSIHPTSALPSPNQVRPLVENIEPVQRKTQTSPERVTCTNSRTHDCEHCSEYRSDLFEKQTRPANASPTKRKFFPDPREKDFVETEKITSLTNDDELCEDSDCADVDALACGDCVRPSCAHHRKTLLKKCTKKKQAA